MVMQLRMGFIEKLTQGLPIKGMKGMNMKKTMLGMAVGLAAAFLLTSPATSATRTKNAWCDSGRYPGKMGSLVSPTDPSGCVAYMNRNGFKVVAVTRNAAGEYQIFGSK